ncbi:AAA family ATPase, partial [Bifidobacterium longum]
MDEAELRSDLATGETPSIEFKRCGNSVGRDTFETICSFANSFGGSIYLGVEDDGNAIGIPEENIVPVKRNVTNVVHNPNVFDPPATLEFEDIVFEGSSLVRIWIPPSPSIHRYKGRIFERIEDADVVVSTESQLTALCVRKQNIYTEQRVFPYVEASDLRMDLLPAIRTMATGKRTRHPWNGMTDEDLLHSAGLFGKNFVTGEKGFNLAAVLLLGDADVIRSLCPSYKTDAVVRISDQDRYDDRVIVTSNLIEAFDQLTGFCTKHLPDRFHLEGSVRVSPRDIIVREVISNMLVHREYTSPFPAKLIIDNERLRTENASRAPFMGRITLSDFNPIPK